MGCREKRKRTKGRCGAERKKTGLRDIEEEREQRETERDRERQRENSLL